jgi:hypothetical protein
MNATTHTLGIHANEERMIYASDLDNDLCGLMDDCCRFEPDERGFCTLFCELQDDDMCVSFDPTEYFDYEFALLGGDLSWLGTC